MVTMQEIIAARKLKEDAPFKTVPTAGEPQVPTSKDIGEEFLSKISHSSAMIQAEVLGILFDHNWEDPRTAEEISAAYIGAPAEERAKIDSLVYGAD